ncbi:MAG: amidohydrolase family protein [Candidatus Dormibacteria bacterium]
MTLILRGGTLFDSTGADLLGDATGDSEVLELDGLTILPGLIDAHTRLGGVFDRIGRFSVAEMAAEVFKNIRLANDAGFTTCREVVGVHAGAVRVIEKGLIRGPRIFHSGSVICQHGGHGDFTSQFAAEPTYGIPGLVCGALPSDGVDAVRHAARISFRRGATQLKVCVSGGVVSLHDSLEDTQLTVEELRAIVEEARARNPYVTAHAQNKQPSATAWPPALAASSRQPRSTPRWPVSSRRRGGRRPPRVSCGRSQVISAVGIQLAEMPPV